MEEKSYWIECLRVLATFSVVILHSASPLLYKYNSISQFSWHIGNLYDSFVRFAVPIFFMISGALILKKEYSTKQFLKNRFWRLIPPFIFWSLIYIAIAKVSDIENTFSFQDMIKTSIINLLYGSKYHLWFIYTILGIYLFIPILRIWIKGSSTKDLEYFLIIWFLTILYGIPYLKFYMPQITVINYSGYLGYFVLGYYLSITDRLSIFYATVLFIIGFLTTLFGTFYITNLDGSFKPTFYDYLSPNVIIASIGVFVFIKKRSEALKYRKFIKKIGKSSYGIYLCHVLILEFISGLGISTLKYPIFSIPLVAILCFFASYFLIRVLGKISFINSWVG